jgi:hypothetical protein
VIAIDLEISAVRRAFYVVAFVAVAGLGFVSLIALRRLIGGQLYFDDRSELANALAGAVTDPAWKSKPSWYLVAIEDRMIPPPAQRQWPSAGAIIAEAAGSHAIYVSKRDVVAALIAKAAKSVGSKVAV